MPHRGEKSNEVLVCKLLLNSHNPTLTRFTVDTIPHRITQVVQGLVWFRYGREVSTHTREFHGTLPRLRACHASPFISQVIRTDLVLHIAPHVPYLTAAAAERLLHLTSGHAH